MHVLICTINVHCQKLAYLRCCDLTLLSLSLACRVKYSIRSFRYFDRTYPTTASSLCAGRPGLFPLPLTLHVESSCRVKTMSINCLRSEDADFAALTAASSSCAGTNTPSPSTNSTCLGCSTRTPCKAVNNKLQM